MPDEDPSSAQEAAAMAAGRAGYTTPPEVRDLWREARVRQVPVPATGHGWQVTGMEEVRFVLSDRRFSRAEARRLGAVIGPAAVFRTPGMNDLDAPEHTRLRRLIAGAFSAHRIRALRPRIQQITDELLGAVVAQGPPADLIDVCRQVPLAVICEILGVPIQDRTRFAGWAERVTSTGAHPPEEAMTALEAMRDYMAELVAGKRRRPDDSLLHALVVARDEQDRLSEDELVGIGCGLLLAGNESTATMLAKGLIALFDHPDQLALLRADPSLVPSAVDEILRYATLGFRPHGGHLRGTTSAVEVGGVAVPAHSLVLACLPAANLDPAAFPDPDQFDVTRRGAADHVAFGYGAHRCLGAQLARTELEVVIGTVLTALPAVRLTVPVEEIPYREGFLIVGVGTLPVVW
jgi:cytochrome P450